MTTSNWRTRTGSTDFTLRLHVKYPGTWTTSSGLRKLGSIEDRYWARSATERMKNPTWISEKEFWRKLKPVS